MHTRICFFCETFRTRARSFRRKRECEWAERCESEAKQRVVLSKVERGGQTRARSFRRKRECKWAERCESEAEQRVVLSYVKRGGQTRGRSLRQETGVRVFAAVRECSGAPRVSSIRGERREREASEGSGSVSGRSAVKTKL